MVRADSLEILCRFSISCARCIGAVVFALLLALLPLAGHADPLSPPPAGSWAAFPNSTLRPAMGNAPWNPNYIFDYSGGWFDEARGELGVWGGGHGDYPGNEIYTFSLATGTWTNLTQRSPYLGPTTNPAPSTSEALADGTPSSRHTYDCMARVNVPGYDGFFCHGGSLWQAGWPTAATWFFHRNTAKWELECTPGVRQRYE